MSETTRRAFLKAGAVAGAGLAAGTGGFGATIDKALAVTPPQGATLKDIEHVVILMQENRTFDHYFGTLRGVRGFSDPDVLLQANGKPIWYQWSFATPDGSGYVLPNHLDSFTTNAQGISLGSNSWGAEHVCWNGGRLDQFVSLGQVSVGAQGVAHQSYTMGYFTRQDLPFHYALADAFTICDGYFTSVMADSNPNWMMMYSGSIDAQGTMGGPILDDSDYPVGSLGWKSYAEELEAAGISWFVYQEADNDGANLLPWFAGIGNAPQSSSLWQRANTIIPTPSGSPVTASGTPYGPALWAKLRSDVQADALPQVSYILANNRETAHSPGGPGDEAYFDQQVLEALTSNPDVWSKTVLFLTYDDAGGLFDHVPPPTAPSGTPGEYMELPFATKGQSDYLQPPGPVGLGYRVPMIVVSPFTRGGYVCHETFDHTSIIRFLEEWTKAKGKPAICGNISDWRRATVGDLTSTLGQSTQGVFDFSTLGDGQQLAAECAQEIANNPFPSFPSPQVLPTQEPGTRPVIGPHGP